jgi:hypothetical protein
MLWKALGAESRNCQRARNHCCYQTANATLVMLSDLEGFGQAKNGDPRGCVCRLPEARRSVVAVHWFTKCSLEIGVAVESISAPAPTLS